MKELLVIGICVWFGVMISCNRPISDGDCPSTIVRVRVLNNGVNVLQDTTFGFDLEEITVQQDSTSITLFTSTQTYDYYFLVEREKTYVVSFRDEQYQINTEFGTSSYGWCDGDAQGVTQLLINGEVVCQGDDCVQNNRLILRL